ncbi:DNA repair protein RadC [Candidatus Pacearchaeota archaeon]|nr:DNA repair protein RadC [Candidatus Pacearchaeota archaeon]
MKIKEMNKDSRPRERLLKFGVKNLSDAELLALILEKGTKQENVIEMSNRLISKYGLDKLSECSLKELQEINGIGFAKSCQVLALFELNKRQILAQKPQKFISSAKAVFEIMHEKLKDEKQENFIAVHLNNRNYFIKEELITKGILDASIIDPREVFKSAIKNSASRVILVHNHPSGDPSPSKEDQEVTEKLIDAGELLGIKILDHIIIGRDKYWSWKENKD